MVCGCSGYEARRLIDINSRWCTSPSCLCHQLFLHCGMACASERLRWFGVGYSWCEPAYSPNLYLLQTAMIRMSAQWIHASRDSARISQKVCICMAGTSIAWFGGASIVVVSSAMGNFCSWQWSISRLISVVIVRLINELPPRDGTSQETPVNFGTDCCAIFFLFWLMVGDY